MFSCTSENEPVMEVEEEKIQEEYYNSRIKYDAFPGFYHTSEVAHYIDSIGTTEEEKAWMLYCWIADNIYYDTDALITGNKSDLQAETVFQTQKAICVGFSTLYKSIGERMDLEVLEIPGFSKGHDYVENSPIYKSNHIWNAVKINGEWKLLDPTWGQGYLTRREGRTINIKQFSEFWFATEPYQFIFTHLPENPAYQFMDESISTEVFQNAPRVEAGYFEREFINENNYKELLNYKKSDLVINYTNGDTVKIKEAPIAYKLNHELNHDFKIKNKAAKNMMIINNEEWIVMEKNNKNEFVFSGELEKGKAVIAVNNNDYDKYDFILEYMVE